MRAVLASLVVAVVAAVVIVPTIAGLFGSITGQW